MNKLVKQTSKEARLAEKRKKTGKNGKQHYNTLTHSMTVINQPKPNCSAT